MKNNKFPLDVTAPGPTQLTNPEPQDADRWDDSLAPKSISDPPALRFLYPPKLEDEIDFPALRNLLFSLRDQNIYCPWCRCPEFSPSPEMRTSHFDDCPLGKMCEKLLRMYPREGAVVKWRK